jgi:hypothetical protein
MSLRLGEEPLNENVISDGKPRCISWIQKTCLGPASCKGYQTALVVEKDPSFVLVPGFAEDVCARDMAAPVKPTPKAPRER